MLFAILIMSCGKDAMSNGKGVNTIQAMLNSGETPKELFDNNVPLDSLYGKMYKGGLIFYLNTSDGTGMVASPEDVGPLEGAEWGCKNTDIISLENVPKDGGPKGKGAEIGDGMANTNAILAECDMPGIASKLCRDLGENWFLPSICELKLMSTNLRRKGHGGDWQIWYWSSTELRQGFSWVHYFINGETQLATGKQTNIPVRAARTF